VYDVKLFKLSFVGFAKFSSRPPRVRSGPDGGGPFLAPPPCPGKGGPAKNLYTKS